MPNVLLSSSSRALFGVTGWQQPKLRAPVIGLQQALNEKGANLASRVIIEVCGRLSPFGREYEPLTDNGLSGRIIGLDDGEIAVLAHKMPDGPPKIVLFKRGNVQRKTMRSALETIQGAVLNG